MEQAKKAYEEVSRECFNKESLLRLNGQILCNDPKSLFSKPIPRSYLTPTALPERLQDPKNHDYLPFPFVFTPSRNACLEKLFPVPGKKINIIEGFSQIGKSNLAAHLCLFYRSVPRKFAVIYIGNLSAFTHDPIGYITKELFYWFFEEINENPTTRTLLQLVMGSEKFNVALSRGEKLKILQSILSKLILDCKTKGKDIILIWDSYNKRFQGKFEKDTKFFSEIASWLEQTVSIRIYITTNTDSQKILNWNKSEDMSSRKIITLDETRNLIPVEQLQILTKELFGIQENDLISLIPSLFQENLPLILLFSKYCLSAQLQLTNKQELFDHFEIFKINYQITCCNAHGAWLKENNFLCQNLDPIKKCTDLIIGLNLDREEENFDSSLLDLRYVYREGLQIKSINIFVKEMLEKLYWTEEIIEKFVNKYYAFLSGSAFGSLFDVYMRLKLKNYKGKILNIKTFSGTISLIIEDFSNVYYRKKHVDTVEQKKSILSENEFITFIDTRSDQNILFNTPQETFPFADVVFHDNLAKDTLWINWRTSASDINEFLKVKRKFFKLYPNQAKEQLSIFHNFEKF